MKEKHYFTKHIMSGEYGDYISISSIKFKRIVMEYRNMEKIINEKDRLLKETIEVIEFYGDKEIYDWTSFEDVQEPVLADEGRKARQLLAKIKEVK